MSSRSFGDLLLKSDPFLSGSTALKQKKGAATAASLLSISKGLRFFSVRIDSWLCKISFAALQGSRSLKQWMRLSSDPSVARFKAHNLKDF